MSSKTFRCLCRRGFDTVTELDEHMQSGDCAADPGRRDNYDEDNDE